MKHYGMFTPEGDAVVGAIVQLAIDQNFSYNNLEKELIKLSKIKFFEEATDTAVREEVFAALREGANSKWPLFVSLREGVF